MLDTFNSVALNSKFKFFLQIVRLLTKTFESPNRGLKGLWFDFRWKKKSVFLNRVKLWSGPRLRRKFKKKTYLVP